MTLKPAWLTRPKILAFGLALVAAGLFTPIYQTAEEVWGVDKTAELFKWILSAKDEVENPKQPPVSPPVVEDSTIKDSLTVDELDISKGVVQVCSNTGNNLRGLESIPALHTMTSARVEGSNVRVAYNVPSSYWASSTEATKFARGFVFWKEGDTIYASHYDWFRPGQTVKTLGNLYNGYVTRRPVGTLYFALISNDAKARTNIKAAR